MMLRRFLLGSRVCRSSCLVSLCGLLAAAGCDDRFFGHGGGFPFGLGLRGYATEHGTQTADPAGILTLRVRNHGGAVGVGVDSSRTDIGIDIFKFARGVDDAEAQTRLGLIQVTIQPAADDASVLEITVQLPPPSGTTRVRPGSGETSGVALRIKLPAGLILDLQTDGGGIGVAYNEGALTAVTDNGPIEVSDQTGDVDVTTANGGVEVDGATGNVRVRCTNGGILVRATPPADGTVDAEATNGPVGIRVPTNFAAALDLATTNGRIFADFTDFTVDNLVQTQKTATATLNGGGGTVRGHTTNGPVSFGGF